MMANDHEINENVQQVSPRVASVLAVQTMLRNRLPPTVYGSLCSIGPHALRQLVADMLIEADRAYIKAIMASADLENLKD